MDTSPPAEDKKGEVYVGAREAGRSNPVALPQEEKISQCVVVLCAEPKEEDSVKADEPGKLQNGESAKDGAVAVSVVNVGEEKKKTTKQRFMFNIADGGFTGGWLHTHTHRYFLNFVSLFCLQFDLFFLFVFFSQSFTPCGRTRRGQPPSPRRPLRFGTAAMTTGSLPASSSILRRRD